VLGSSIGQYRIVREIGVGGMGRVFAAEHVLLGRRAAIKTLLPTLAVHPEIVERFFMEARATSSIQDPGVIQIYDFGYHVDGTAYIVMELLEGESLAARLERAGRLAVAEAIRIARQLAGSLASAHGKGIVHRDLKPENIYLIMDREAQGGERPKLLDFGICKVVGPKDPSLTQLGTTFGTPAYMSPEQCRGARDLDQRSDIYALGCLLFHMLAGRPPFVSDAAGEFLAAHLRDEPPPPSKFVPGLAPAIDQLVLRCLAKSPDDRYATMMALGDALSEVASVTAIDEALVDAMITEAVDRAVAESGEIAAAAADKSADAGSGLRASGFGGMGTARTGSGTRVRTGARTTANVTDDVFIEPPPRKRRGRFAAIAFVMLAAVGMIGAAAFVFVDERAELPSANAAANPAPVAAPIAAPVPVPVPAPVPPKPEARSPKPAPKAISTKARAREERPAPRSKHVVSKAPPPAPETPKKKRNEDMYGTR
jgi:hypothetical protein